MGFGTGYTSVSDYLGANQGTVANERDSVISDFARQGDAARAADDAVLAGVKPQSDYSTLPGYLDALKGEQNFVADAKNLGTEPGISTTLQHKYSPQDPTYTTGKASFDASLLTGNPAITHASDAGKLLDGYLNKSAEAIASQPLPPPPPPPPPPKDPNGLPGMTPSGPGPGGGREGDDGHFDRKVKPPFLPWPIGPSNPPPKKPKTGGH